jgi:hypothetical protein
VKYLGTRTGSHAYNVNGRRYVFGDNTAHRIVPIYVADVEKLINDYPGLFQAV